MPQVLVVNEIYPALQGEGTRSGRRCTIVRLTGCNLRCRWCDSIYAYYEGRQTSVDDVLDVARRMGNSLVLVTGGEPLTQAAAPELLARLCDAGHEVLLETNGSMDIGVVDERVARCVDVKCPGSGQAGSFLASKVEALRAGDEVKFVLADREDYGFARRTIDEHDLARRCPVVLTPAADLLAARDLAAWMLADADLAAGVRLGLQLHKIIWPDLDRGV